MKINNTPLNTPTHAHAPWARGTLAPTHRTHPEAPLPLWPRIGEGPEEPVRHRVEGANRPEVCPGRPNVHRECSDSVLYLSAS